MCTYNKSNCKNETSVSPPWIDVFVYFEIQNMKKSIEVVTIMFDWLNEQFYYIEEDMKHILSINH